MGTKVRIGVEMISQRLNKAFFRYRELGQKLAEIAFTESLRMLNYQSTISELGIKYQALCFKMPMEPSIDFKRKGTIPKTDSVG
jgi:hypothetical protein